MTQWIASIRSGFLVLSTLVVTAPMLNGCAKDEPAAPPPPPPEVPFSVLVSPATLHGWLANGYGTDENGYSKMVVLDVTAATGATNSYAAGHIPGSFLVSTASPNEVSTSRDDGLGGTYTFNASTASNAIAEVATAAMMNPVIQRTGIDANTVVVLTGDGLMNVAMEYFNLRYWGFPRERLRVLDTTNAGYAAADPSHALTTDPTTLPTPSTYSVCDLVQNIWLRATLSDMILAAEGSVPNVVIWDVRKPSEYAGDANQTTGPFGQASGNFTAFEGHIKGAVNLEYNNVALMPTATSIGDPGTIKATLATSIGVTGDETTYVYCRTAGRASISFLMLDGMLGYNARLYDASWIEWGNMALLSSTLNPNGDAGLAADSRWRTDVDDRSESIRYNTAVDVITGADSYAVGTDLVNMTDASPVCVN